MVDVKYLEQMFEAAKISIPASATITEERAGLLAVHDYGWWQGYKRAKQEYQNGNKKSAPDPHNGGKGIG